jgi:hypothetical protein
MALVRACPLKDFTDTANPLSTTANGTALSTGVPSLGQKVYAALSLTVVSTGRTFAATVQSASSSGFGTPTTEFAFALTSAIGTTWLSLAAPSTDRPWRRARWVLSTVASTAGSWNGLIWVGIR